mgnify:CR=1 FL=1
MSKERKELIEKIRELPTDCQMIVDMLAPEEEDIISKYIASASTDSHTDVYDIKITITKRGAPEDGTQINVEIP